LHGRNRNWYEAGEKERYNYLYTKEELESSRKEIIDFLLLKILYSSVTIIRAGQYGVLVILK